MPKTKDSYAQVLPNVDDKLEVAVQEILDAKAQIQENTVRPKRTSYMLDVPYIYQYPYYPTGCESVSTCMVLQYYGIDMSVDKFIEQYLPIGYEPYYSGYGLVGDSPNDYFLGSPYSEYGYGCFAPVIATALEKIVNDKWEVKTLYNKSLDDLCHDYIDEDYPVILWASMYMEDPFVAFTFQDVASGEIIEWKQPMHCLVLVGYDKDYYYFNDPMIDKQVRFSKWEVENAYSKMGSQAVVMVNPE